MFSFFKKNKSKWQPIEVIGEKIPFKILFEENMQYSNNRTWKVLRKDEDKKYWENLKPYEIIDGNFCVRICDRFDDSHYGAWMVFTKDELTDILSKM